MNVVATDLRDTWYSGILSYALAMTTRHGNKIETATTTKMLMALLSARAAIKSTIHGRTSPMPIKHSKIVKGE